VIEAPARAERARPTWRALLAEGRARLGADHEAARIVEAVSGMDAGALATELDERAPARAAASFEAMISRRLAGEPLQYVLGAWGFRRLDLMVDERVLIPRPETETVVEVALEELGRLAGIRPERAPVVADLGTGSGAIALSLAVERPGAVVWASELSADALAVARANLAGLGGRAAARVRLVAGRWFDALPDHLRGRLDLVVSNPPYVAEDEVADLPPEVAGFEPGLALVAGPTGLEAIAEIVDAAPGWLVEGGGLVVEIAPHQAEAAVGAARAAGFEEAEVRPDLAGRDRVLRARL
jgi:release factor glutamine methyltransferase